MDVKSTDKEISMNHEVRVVQLINHQEAITCFDSVLRGPCCVNESSFQRGCLMRAFRPPVSNASEVRAMAVNIVSWLFTRGIRIPGPLRVQAMALIVVRRAEHDMASSVMAAIPVYVLLW